MLLVLSSVINVFFVCRVAEDGGGGGIRRWWGLALAKVSKYIETQPSAL
jgi:hypothetical protein